MKIRCKKCHKHFKVKKGKDVPCDKGDCDIKFKMSDDLLEFDGFEEALLKDITVIDDFKTEKPKIVTKEMTEQEWAMWCEHNMGVGPNQRDLI